MNSVTGAQQPPVGSPPGVRRGGRRRAGLWIAIGAGGVVVVLAAGLVLAFGLHRMMDTEHYTVAGDAMAPTLKRGTTVTATKVGAGRYTPKRGDVVIFGSPPSWHSNHDMVLRVIATPNETVSYDGQHLLVDGHPLNEPYAHDGGGARQEGHEQVVVPAGRVWLMGDNRSAAIDSSVVYALTHDVAEATVGVDAVTGVVTM